MLIFTETGVPFSNAHQGFVFAQGAGILYFWNVKKKLKPEEHLFTVYQRGCFLQ